MPGPHPGAQAASVMSPCFLSLQSSVWFLGLSLLIALTYCNPLHSTLCTAPSAQHPLHSTLCTAPCTAPSAQHPLHSTLCTIWVCPDAFLPDAFLPDAFLPCDETVSFQRIPHSEVLFLSHVSIMTDEWCGSDRPR